MVESQAVSDKGEHRRADPLLASCWHAHLTYDFDAGTEIHPSVFDVVFEILGDQPHFCHEVGSTLHVALTVLDGSPGTRSRLQEQARAIAAELPNAQLSACDLTEAPDPFSQPRSLNLVGPDN